MNIIQNQFNFFSIEGNIMAKISKVAPKVKSVKGVKKVAAKAEKTTVTKTTSAKSAGKSAADKKVKYPEKYTSAAMVGYVAEKHDLARNQAKEIMETIFDVINSGVTNGERVPIGKFGKMYVKTRPARKARKGRNPITGQEITIPPKKATKIPKFVFSKAFKEIALKAKAKG